MAAQADAAMRPSFVYAYPPQSSRPPKIGTSDWVGMPQAAVFTPMHTHGTHFFARIAKELPALAPDAILWLGVDLSHADEVRAIMREAGWHEAAVTVPSEGGAYRFYNPSILLEFSFRGPPVTVSMSSVDASGTVDRMVVASSW